MAGQKHRVAVCWIRSASGDSGHKLAGLIGKYAFLAWFGGSFYVSLEVFWRGRSHWTMFILAAVLFLALGLLNEKRHWGLLIQMLAGTGIATAAELVAGCIINRWLGWGIWDYSDQPGNLLGQVCPQYAVLWAGMSIIAIVLDDVIRWRFFHEEKPKYTWF